MRRLIRAASFSPAAIILVPGILAFESLILSRTLVLRSYLANLFSNRLTRRTSGHSMAR